MITLTRFVTLAALSAFVALPAQAKSKKDAFCEELGAASQEIANLRLDGSSETDAQLAAVEYFGEDKVTHLQMIPYLSNYVYGLTDEQLDGEVGTAFETQCKDYSG